MAWHGSVSHDWQKETLEAKARWFRSLPMADRMDLLCAFTDLALSVNPALKDQRHAQPASGRVQVLRLPSAPEGRQKVAPGEARGNEVAKGPEAP
jgi:hypothetical protein